MASKRSRQASDDNSAGGEDFKLINSISWKMENRLHRAGITTYAQMAASSPTEIASQLGNPAGLLERIAKENWIGQARQLAELDTQTKSKNSTKSPARKEGGQRYETFATELLLAADKQVLHTRVMHVPSGDEELWEGWDDRRLINFFAQRADLPLAVGTQAPELTPEPLIQETKSAIPIVADTRQSNLPLHTPEQPQMTAGEVFAKAASTRRKSQEAPLPATALVEAAAARVLPIPKPVGAVEQEPAHKLEIRAVPSGPQTRLLRQDQPFTVRLMLNLPNPAAGKNPLAYTATIQARNLGGKGEQTVHRTQGRIFPGGEVVIEVGGMCLKPGTYRLAAMANLKPADQHQILTSATDFHVEGGVIQVY